MEENIEQKTATIFDELLSRLDKSDPKYEKVLTARRVAEAALAFAKSINKNGVERASEELLSRADDLNKELTSLRIKRLFKQGGIMPK